MRSLLQETLERIAADQLALIAETQEGFSSATFQLVNKLVAAYGEDGLANRVAADLPSDTTWRQLADLLGIMIWSTSDNGSAIFRSTDAWLLEGSDERLVLAALHLDTYPFRERKEMEQVLTSIAEAFPRAADRCRELIASRRREAE